MQIFVHHVGCIALPREINTLAFSLSGRLQSGTTFDKSAVFAPDRCCLGVSFCCHI